MTVRLLALGALGVAIGAFAAPAAATFDCTLPNLSCNELQAAYRAAVPDVEGLSVVVRSTELPTAYCYRVEVARAAQRLELQRETPKSVADDEALLQVVGLLQQASLPFLSMQGNGTVEDGVLRVAFETDVPEEAPADANEPWFIRPSAWANFQSAGVRIGGVGGGLEVNYSGEAARVRARGDFTYRYLSFDLPDQSTIEGGFASGSGSLVGSVALDGGLSAGLRSTAHRAPNNNLEVRAAAGGGVEWLQRPMLETGESNIGGRLTVEAVYDQYVTGNRYGELALVYPQGTASAFARWHQERMDFSLSAEFSTPMHRPADWGIDAGGEVTFRPGGGLEIGISAGLAYRNGAIEEPVDRDQLDSVATLLGGTNFVQVSYRANLSLSYAFGNSLLRSQDQRWR